MKRPRGLLSVLGFMVVLLPEICLSQDYVPGAKAPDAPGSIATPLD